MTITLTKISKRQFLNLAAQRVLICFNRNYALAIRQIYRPGSDLEQYITYPSVSRRGTGLSGERQNRTEIVV